MNLSSIVRELYISWLCAGLLVFAMLMRLPFFFQSVIDWDESTFILMGQDILDGHLPYTELWDNKPPLTFAFFAMVLSLWKSLVAVRLAGAFAVFVSAYLTFLVGRHIWGNQTGTLGAVITIVFISLAHSGQATSSEIIALVPLMGALTVLVTKGVNASSCFVIGLLISLAVLVRLNLGYLAVLVGTVIVFRSWAGGWNLVMRNTGAYVVAGVVPLGVVMLPYVISGEEQLFLKSVFVAPLRYTEAYGSTLSSVLSLVKKSVSASNVSLLLGVLGGLVCIGRQWSAYDGDQKLGLGSIANVSLGIGCSIIFGGASHPHYVIQLIPISSLVAACVMVWLLRSRYQKMVLVLCVVGFVWLTKPILKQYVIVGSTLARGSSVFSDEGYQIAAYLGGKNLGGEKIYMVNYPIVYWLLGKKPIRKSVTHPSLIEREYLLKVFLGKDVSTESEMIALLRQRPLYVVKNSGDSYLRGLAGRLLAEQLSADYEVVKVFNDAYIYKRRGSSGAMGSSLVNGESFL